MQGFFKDMNAICKVLNIGQTVTNNNCFEFSVKCFEKLHEGSGISAKVIVKNL